MINHRLIFAAALVLAAPSLAEAQSWQRTVSEGAATVTAEGARGGSYTRSSTCANGRPGCSTSFSGTGPQGRSFSGTRESFRGPFRGRAVTTVTGPRGNTGVRARRWRR